jgi:hypothetical protein
MKPNLLNFVFLLFLFAISCKKEENPKPDSNYVGILTLEYSRSFPEFSTTITMEVEIDKSGEIYISEPDQVEYSGEDEMDLDGSLIRQNETGTITITSLNGAFKEKNGEGYLSVNAHTLIDGIQITWAWDDDLGWIQLIEEPFSLEDPVESPMDFNIDDAVVAAEGSQLGATMVVEPFGTVTYMWTLILVVGIK